MLTKYGYSFDKMVYYRGMLVVYWLMFNLFAVVTLLLKRGDWALWKDLVSSAKDYIFGTISVLASPTARGDHVSHPSMARTRFRPLSRDNYLPLENILLPDSADDPH